MESMKGENVFALYLLNPHQSHLRIFHINTDQVKRVTHRTTEELENCMFSIISSFELRASVLIMFQKLIG